MKEQKEASHLAVDELEITRALRVAVTRAILGSCLVTRVLTHATISVHLDEVEGTVDATRNF